MFNLTDFFSPKDQNRKFEDADAIEITRNTIKFGSSLYQFRNLTGLTIGKIPKKNFPIVPTLIFGVAGILFLFFDQRWIGLISLAVVLFFVVRYLNEKKLYGLILYLNSGQERIFLSNDHKFLMKIVNGLYDFMSKQMEGSFTANFVDNSTHYKPIIVGRDLHGKAVTGDENIVT